MCSPTPNPYCFGTSTLASLYLQFSAVVRVRERLLEEPRFLSGLASSMLCLVFQDLSSGPGPVGTWCKAVSYLPDPTIHPRYNSGSMNRALLGTLSTGNSWELVGELIELLHASLLRRNLGGSRERIHKPAYNLMLPVSKPRTSP